MKEPKLKKPSLKGMENTKYLGHFAQDKYIQEGHNLSWLSPAAGLASSSAQAAGNVLGQSVLNAEKQAKIREQKRIQNLARPGSATTLSQGLAGLVNKLRASRLRKRKSPPGGNMPGDGGGF